MKKKNKIDLRGKIVVVKQCEGCKDRLLAYTQQKKCDICGGRLIKK